LKNNRKIFNLDILPTTRSLLCKALYLHRFQKW
jgi:hypothetical protein